MDDRAKREWRIWVDMQMKNCRRKASLLLWHDFWEAVEIVHRRRSGLSEDEYWRRRRASKMRPCSIADCR